MDEATIDDYKNADGSMDHRLSATGGAAPVILNVNVEELLGQASVPGYLAPLFNQLTAHGKASLLSLNPWAQTNTPNAHPALDPARFISQGSVQIEGPHHPGDLSLSSSIGLSNEIVDSSNRENSVGSQDTVLGGIEVDWFFKGGAKAGFRWKFEWTSAWEDSSGKETEAALKIGTAEPCYHQTSEVYFDKMVGSYAFSTNQASSDCNYTPPVSGSVKNARGTPLSGIVVVATSPDGSTHKAVSDAYGTYRFWDVDASSNFAMKPSVAGDIVIVPTPTAPPPMDCSGIRCVSNPQ